MTTSKWLGLACYAVAAMAVGCTHYSTPLIDSDFDGIAAASSKARVVRVVFIHGMGDHFPGYSDALVATLSARLNLGSPTSKEKRIVRYKWTDHEAARIHIARLAGAPGKPEFRVYEITWSPLTIPVKDHYLNFDRAPQYKLHRAPINKALKEELLDRNLADAVLYLGKFGEALRWTMEQGLCHALNDRHTGDGQCDLAGTDIAGLERDEVVFITSSLGSRMMFDTLAALRNPKSELKPDPKKTRVAESSIAQTNLVFMLANQIPLLELGVVDKPIGGDALAETKTSEGGLRAFTRLWSEIKGEREKDLLKPIDAVLRSLHVVAFSDPNDILSYQLPPGAADGDKDIKLTNVVVTNTAEILWLFARPDKAHTSYDQNSAVLDLVVCGSKERRVACAPR